MTEHVVIDANIFKAYFDVTVSGVLSSLTDCPTKIFQKLGDENGYIAHIDDGGRIKQEWKDVVDPQWFEVWFSGELIADHITHTDPLRDASLEAKLRADGFPRGRDLVYVRVSRQVASINSTCKLISEDLDFFSPKQKKCPARTRQKILANSLGNVAKLLRKSDVEVMCVANAVV